MEGRWGLEICHMFPDSTVLKQYFNCSFSSVGGENHTIGQFWGISEPLGACMED